VYAGEAMQGYGDPPVRMLPGRFISLAFASAGVFGPSTDDAGVSLHLNQGKQMASLAETIANIIANTIKALIIDLISFLLFQQLRLCFCIHIPRLIGSLGNIDAKKERFPKLLIFNNNHDRSRLT
jgi:hypothetical protein